MFSLISLFFIFLFYTSYLLDRAAIHEIFHRVTRSPILPILGTWGLSSISRKNVPWPKATCKWQNNNIGICGPVLFSLLIIYFFFIFLAMRASDAFMYINS
ncbi:hypothetical protein BDV29DRAFT_147178 [Aspergillus leporis]|uniref:Uncharacterized protein n=1 Tax=Aspergillus leporis TaxID=41062 RepID=A0A5N5X0A3_9EURO|nr:hypothetical protein BDV29DRAFT_147178 [Aspergillus leporis]